MSPKKGNKSNTSNYKGSLEDRCERKCPSYFKTKDYRANNLTAPVNEILCYISTETSKSESHEKIFLNTCDKNRSSNENPQRHLVTARQLKVLYTRCSLCCQTGNMAVGKFLYTEMINKQENKIQSEAKNYTLFLSPLQI